MVFIYDILNRDKMHGKSVSCLVTSSIEACRAHFKSELLRVITKVSRGKVSQGQLLHSLSLHLQHGSIGHGWSRLPGKRGREGGLTE